MPFSELLSLDNWSCNSDSIGFGGETELFVLTGVVSLATDMDEEDDVLGLLIGPFEAGSMGSIRKSHKNNICLEPVQKKPQCRKIHYILKSCFVTFNNKILIL